MEQGPKALSLKKTLSPAEWGWGKNPSSKKRSKGLWHKLVQAFRLNSLLLNISDLFFLIFYM
jgi:hypothetical protein